MSPASIRRLTRAIRHLCTRVRRTARAVPVSRCCARRSRSHSLFPLLSHRALNVSALSLLVPAPKMGRNRAEQAWCAGGQRITNEPVPFR